MQWTLLIPLKPLVRAKSRLSDTAGDGLRPGLALAFAADTVAAATACSSVRDVVVITDDALAGRELGALGATIIPDTPRRGLNAALSHGEAAVRGERPTAAVAALNADLPALRTAELGRVLTAAASPRAFLADTAGTGTTLLAAAPGTPLRPLFGGASRLRHLASGAVELAPDQVESVRRDVDTGADLRAALSLGVGPRTAAAAAGLLIPDRFVPD
ncbi:2-phospho-L-lactate guanylyltransferase [Streptomyces sp. NPDC058045]|uniref:2-phospho-L-lactate guanylyltransferase n=1 Tax=Streptomyces sp. NPDC058045 TaxID=3346311 RepID=UPI0036E4A0F2